MKLTVLCDNNTITDVYLTGEPALSFFIEDSGKNILFDTGYSDVFIKNAEILGIDLLQTDHIVLSHNHNDHTGGLLYLKEMYEKADSEGLFYKRPVIVAHPQIFREVRAEGFGDIGCPLNIEDIEAFADIMLSDVPVKITDNITFLGEIVETTPFEIPCAAGVSKDPDEKFVPDYQPDDSALLYPGDKGIVIITGCSHKGICSVVKQAVKTSERSDLFDIIGGFHLLGADKMRLERTGEFLAAFDMKCIHPCHCTDLSAKIKLAEYVDIGDVGCGFVVEF